MHENKEIWTESGSTSTVLMCTSDTDFIFSYNHLNQNVLFFLQKIIYKQMKISAAVRVIKGQEVLQDGSTLDEHGIIDGATVNIVIEPDKEISIKMKLGPKEFTRTVKSSDRVGELKQQLIDGGIVGFKNFSLVLCGTTAEDDVPLLQESLPLHLYGVSDNTMIRIIGGRVQIHLATSGGQKWLKSFPKNITISQMKQRIRLVDRFFSAQDKDLLDDVWLFVQRGESFQRIDDDYGEAPIGSVLSNNDVIYLVEERFISADTVFRVYYKRKEIGRVWWKITTDKSRYPPHQSDTVLSLKLRIQELLGFPVSCVDVKASGQSMGNNETLHDYDIILPIGLRIEVV